MISVAVATYNGEKYIEKQLKSICTQTRIVDEIVIVDDGSMDSTVAIVQEYVDKYPECNIRLFKNTVNLGYKKNFHKAMSLCEGDIIFLCDQDDIWKENKVDALSKLLESNQNIELVSSSFIQIDGDGNEVSGNKSAYMRKMDAETLYQVPIEDLVFHNISQGCAMAFKKEIRDLFLQHFIEELPHDWLLNVIAAMRKTCYYLCSPMFFYRIHGENTIGLNEGLTLKRKNSLTTRTYDAVQAIKVLDLIQKIDSGYYQGNHKLDEMRKFSSNHIDYLSKKRLLGIVFQNANPYYKKLKTVRGRLLDMFFCVKK